MLPLWNSKRLLEVKMMSKDKLGIDSSLNYQTRNLARSKNLLKKKPEAQWNAILKRL